jgi:hypothetical protein
VIKDIKVKESMRDLSGSATRVNVDVSFIQVPQYQVDSGRDQASQAVTGSKAAFPEQQVDQTSDKKSGPNAANPKAGAKPKTGTGARGGAAAGGGAADAAGGGAAGGGGGASGGAGNSIQESYAARYARERGV